MVVQCCVCHRVRQENEWVTMSRAVEMRDKCSHGYCPRCAAEACEEINRLHSANNRIPQPAV